jgi:hypothetical protein
MAPLRAVPVTSLRIHVLATIAMLLSLGDAQAVEARGKPRECKPNGLPVAIGGHGAIALAEPLEYLGESRILAADKLVKPSKLRLISRSGEAIELPNPPWTVEPHRWLSRGRAVYAVGTGRSQTEGKADIVLVRWGTDSRPRLTKVATVDRVVAPPRAALVGEFMAVLWSESSATGAAQVKASFLDIEELKVFAVQDLGTHASSGFLEVVTAGKGFIALWAAEGSVKQQRFDARGKSSGAAASLPWNEDSTLRSALACGERVWLLHEGGTDKLAVSTIDASGATKRVAQLAASPNMERWPMLCADDGVLVAHRTVQAKAGSVVFWISTIEPSGKVRERRVKDTQGTAETIRMPQLAAAGNARAAYWIEGAGPGAKLWSREIVCE